MRSRIIIFAIISIGALLWGCQVDGIEVKDGIYKGTFTVTYSSGTQTGRTTLELKDGRFSCSGNSDRIPAGGSGTFSADNNKITFNDENPWTADFDWGLILSGVYDYTFDGKKLLISSNNNGVGQYKYDLEKQ
ncbi:hypothetical protein [Echinicola rosea]|uniref:hypothetical protein n=1 Tax=Echinicola rosea TaxID=1807691 RepID=UPI0010CA9800|nr:hypothetical protein [Echinicola rosea]